MLKNLLKIHEIIIAYSKIPLMMNEFNSVTKQIFSEYSSIVHFFISELFQIIYLLESVSILFDIYLFQIFN